MSALSSLGFGVLGSIIAAELLVLVPPTAKLLSKGAARLAPVELRERLEEEWLAHLEEVPGGVTKLVLILGFVLAGIRIRAVARGFGPPRIFDALFAIAGLIVGLPALLLISIGLIAEQRGPVVFRAPQLGRMGKPFTAYEFRLRYEADGKTLKRFSRILHSGNWERYLGLINVARGDMALFGSRATRCECDECCESRKEARPGLTPVDEVEWRANRVGLPSPSVPASGLGVWHYIECLRVELLVSFRCARSALAENLRRLRRW